MQWRKRRWRCRTVASARQSFAEQVAQVPAGMRTTTRLRAALAWAVEDGRDQSEVAAAQGVSWPTMQRAVVVHGAAELVEPQPVRVLGMDETRFGEVLPPGVSPYATGGGGVTFERKVAVTYLAHLLVGDGAHELGDARRVEAVAFQQDLRHRVDDLVITAARVDEVGPSLVLAVAVRRAPNLVRSDELAQKLVRDFVQDMITAPVDGPEHRFALVVAGQQDHAQQLAWLARLAADQVAAEAFSDLVRTPNKFPADVRRRLGHVEGLVEQALTDLDATKPDAALVQQRAWELLARLHICMPRLEAYRRDRLGRGRECAPSGGARWRSR